MYRNILIPVDDQEQSYAAIRVAGTMAACEKASITLLHVRRPPQGVVTDIVTEDRLFELPLREREQRMFAAGREILAGFGIEPKIRAVEAENTAAEILRECAEGAYDAIVMGHRGRRVLQQLVMGSVANGILAGSKCPVIMVHVPPE